MNMNEVNALIPYGNNARICTYDVRMYVRDYVLEYVQEGARLRPRGDAVKQTDCAWLQ